MPIFYDIAPYETVHLSDHDVIVYQDGDEEATVWVDEDETLRLSSTNGQWRVKVIRRAEQ